jgi:hypothetical protein
MKAIYILTLMSILSIGIAQDFTESKEPQRPEVMDWHRLEKFNQCRREAQGVYEGNRYFGVPKDKAIDLAKKHFYSCYGNVA